MRAGDALRSVLRLPVAPPLPGGQAASQALPRPARAATPEQHRLPATPAQDSSPEALSGDLSLSDSEPSASPPSGRREAAIGKERSRGAAAEKRTGKVPKSPPQAAPRPPFAWLSDFSHEQRRRLRQCHDPHAAHKMLAEGCSAVHALPSVPTMLLDDLRKHTQAAHCRAMDLEEELERQVAAHKAELEAIREEHRKACKRAKLQLLAQCAPSRAAAHEAFACDAAESSARQRQLLGSASAPDLRQGCAPAPPTHQSQARAGPRVQQQPRK